MARPRNMEGHRDDIPGLQDNAAWCGNCRTHCGGSGPRCPCCGGPDAQEQEKSVAADAIAQSGVPMSGGTQVSPSAGPGRQDVDTQGNQVSEPADEPDSEPEDRSGSSRRGRRHRNR